MSRSQSLTPWDGWGGEAFSRSRALGKPVLLSLTASWCDACHRMDEETWEDPAVAQVVARETVPVRVDADARPDLYVRYHLGGLPSVALLGPDGDFVRGATFLSPPQFFAFLEAGLGDFKAGRRPPRRPPAVQRRPASLADEVVARLLRRTDLEQGGFGSAPKLVETEALALLLARWRSTRHGAFERILRLTLDAIRDHLSDPKDGGFFRYAAAADWSSPHTEKVTVDQARVIRLFLEAGSAFAEPSYIESARRGLAHARRGLADSEGRVLSSVRADPEYYARTRAAGDPPMVDRRRFADAGAAMISAAWLGFAITGEAPRLQPEFRLAASDGIIPHRLDEPEGIFGLLQDQALGIEAALMQYRLSGDPALLLWARRAADSGIRRLWDETAGAFRAAPAESDGAPALPPIFPLLANGEMALALLGLAAHAGVEGYRPYAERVVETLSSQALASPAGPAVALAAQRLEDKPAEADLHGDPGDARAVDLARAVVRAMGPAAVVRWNRGTDASVTFCVRDLCLPPIGDPRELLQSLVDLDLAPEGILGVQSSSQRDRNEEAP